MEREAPDIVCLQELKTPDARFPAAALEKAGYGAIWQVVDAQPGVALPVLAEVVPEGIEAPVGETLA
ncbi:hypothetical protein [Pseudomonas aeruginosa]